MCSLYTGDVDSRYSGETTEEDQGAQLNVVRRFVRWSGWLLKIQLLLGDETSSLGLMVGFEDDLMDFCLVVVSEHVLCNCLKSALRGRN